MPISVLHILYQSWPNNAGSSIRSDNILRMQLSTGLQIEVITSPGQTAHNSSQNLKYEEHLGIQFHRTHLISGSTIGKKKSVLNRIKKIITFPYFLIRIFNLSRKNRPDILHAHAMSYCGIAALIVGKLQKIPVVYEVRSLWFKNSHAMLGKVQQFCFEKLERYVVRHVDGFVGISEGIMNAF